MRRKGKRGEKKRATKKEKKRATCCYGSWWGRCFWLLGCKKGHLHKIVWNIKNDPTSKMKHLWYVLNNDAISNMMVMFNFLCSTYFRVDFLKACFPYIIHLTALSLPSQVFLAPLALSCCQLVASLILGHPYYGSRILYLAEHNNRELKQRRRRRPRKRHLKSEFALLQTLPRLFHLV